MKKVILFISLAINYCVGQSITLDPRASSAAGLQVKSDMAFTKQKRETVNGGYPNYNRDNSSVFIFEGGGVLSGIADGQDGLIVYVFNGYPTGAISGNLTLQHENASSIAANRILTSSGTDENIGNGGVTLMYDGSKQRWRVANPQQIVGGILGSGWGLAGNAGTSSSTNFIGTTDAQDLKFKTNNLLRATIKENGNMGIGAVDPVAKLHIFNGSAGVIIPNVNEMLVLENPNQAGIGIRTGTSGLASINFVTQVPGRRGWIEYSHIPDKMSIGSSGIEQMVITSTGKFGLGNSNPAYKLDLSSDLAFGLRVKSSSTISYVDIDAANGTSGIRTLANGSVKFTSLYNQASDNFTISSVGASNPELVINGTTENVGIGTSTPSSKLEVNGYTKLGISAPAIKIYKIIGTSPSTQGGSVSILTDGISASKIISIQVMLEWATNQYVPSSYNFANNFEFDWASSATEIVIKNAIGNSANILSKPVKILITYEE